jgi:tetratricopeptide (TPR) repeat protein
MKIEDRGSKIDSGTWPRVLCLSTFVSGLSTLSAFSPLHAEDRVTVRTETGSGQAILTGTVLDWNGERLRLKANDGVREFDAARVADVVSPRLPTHVVGLKALAEGRADEARASLTKALAEEPRQWMRREILAAVVRADLAREDRAAAGKDFLALLDSDPNTRHFHLIPLDWETQAPSAGLSSAARGWMQGSAGDAAKLLAASVLLFDSGAGKEAAETLDRLARSSDRKIYTLARAQLWRQQLAGGTVAAGEIERWEDRIKDIPEPLRGGPYFLLGRAWAGRGDPERAAAAYLWLPLVYDGDGGLTASAAVSAAEELTKFGRTADAVQLYREVLTRWPETSSAGRAKAQLERWSSEAARDADRTDSVSPLQP